MKTINDISGKIYFVCTACMSVWADALSWANANQKYVTEDIQEADNIIVLSCQVTDLAVLNDFHHTRKLKNNYPNKNIFISGCLSNREDIELPKDIERLEQMRCNYQQIHTTNLVKWENPFWVKDYQKQGQELSQGNLFRNRYPLRIGKGCKFNCTYCTIRKTRGNFEQYDINEETTNEFLNHKDVVLIADSPTIDQINDWCDVSYYSKKPLSIRNIEPQVAMSCLSSILKISHYGFLDVFHCPIQSNSEDVLKDMQRNVRATKEIILLSKYLKETYSVKIATNIIIDYKDYPNNFEEIYNIYNYVSWNPFWNGIWNESLAKERFKKYLGYSLD